ncbi:MAG TPA: protein kinase [Terracidiphilus sp.]|nr:protein kinase [Terracidiphilus sp.]
MLHSAQRWQQIESLFHQCLDLPEELRSRFLTEQSGGDLELRKEVESLLASAAQPMDFLEQPVIQAAGDLASGPAANRLSPGVKLGRYQITSFIGSGGMGQVYLARDTQLSRNVAVKILSPGLTLDERGLRRLEKEARAASALNHPNILTIYEFGGADALHYIASEYVEGHTLRRKLDEGPLPLHAAIDIAIQVARALGAAHASGIVHRDIKPENIVIRTDNLVKVVDFGIAKLSESHSRQSIYPPGLALSLSASRAGMVVGSARYMSPEQARGLPVDPRSDIFSLGIVLYEMLCGRCPFDGETVSDVISEILKGTPQSLAAIVPNAPVELQQIVAKAMAKDLEARYQNVREMLAGLEDFASHLQFEARFPAPRPAPPVAAPAKPPRASMPRGARLALALVVVFLAVAAGVFAILHGGQAASPTQAHPRTLAILPFHNLRQDASLNYLGFSLADAIITELSSVKGLIVRPSASIYAYRDRTVDPQEVGRELHVDTLLTGGFLKDGDDFHITAQLIDLEADRILWRDTIDVKFNNLLTVQDRVSRDIVKGLELDLSPDLAQNANAMAPQAYQDYLRGVDFFSTNDFSQSIAMLQKSAALDPNYAPTWAQLGKAYAAVATLQLGGRQQYDRARTAYEKAIALDPNLVQPRIYMANMLTDTGSVEQAVPLLRSALQTAPNDAEAHWELGYAYRFAGMLQQSVDECQRARQLDPQVKLSTSEINAYLYLGEYARFLDSLPSLDVAYVLFYRGFGEYYLHNAQQAARDFDRAYTLNPDLIQAKIGEVLSDSIHGRRDAGLTLLHATQDAMEDRGVGDAESMYKIAQAYAVLGDRHDALHALSHTVEGGFFCSSCFATDPLLAGIRADPEFQRLSNDARSRHDEFKAQFF